MDTMLFTPSFYGLSPGSNQSIEALQRHVKDNLIQIDFNVKRNFMPKLKSSKLGVVVRHFRKQADLSEDQLAEKMGVSKTLISQIENAVTGLTEATLEAFLNATGVTPGQFFDVAHDLAPEFASLTRVHKASLQEKKIA